MNDFILYFLKGVKMGFGIGYPSVYETSYATWEYILTPSQDQFDRRDDFTVSRTFDRRSGRENAFYPTLHNLLKIL